MPKVKTPAMNKRQMNLLELARRFSAEFKLGNTITKKRLAGTLRSLPLTRKKVNNAMKTLGFAGGKRKTRRNRH